MSKKNEELILFFISAFLIVSFTGKIFSQSSHDIDENRLWKFAKDLSAPDMKGRLTGTAEGKLSESYVEKMMRSLNLEVKTQTVKFPLYEVLSPISMALIDKDNKILRSFAYIKDYREVDFSGSGTINGDLIFAGYGVEGPDNNPYKKVDVKGKIAVVLTGIPKGLPREAEFARIDKKVDLACKNGAIGMIIIPTGRLADHIAQRKDEAKMWALGLKRELHHELIHDDFPVVFIHKDTVQPIMGKTTEDLVKNPEPKIIGKRVHLELNSRIYKKTESKNIIGILHGTDAQLKNEVIVLGAHYDHLGLGADGRIYYGAADNASGTAVVMETAHIFAQSAIKPKRTIVFALWCGEEQGLHGSKHYVEKEPLLPIKNTKLMIQVDYLDDQHGPCVTNLDKKEIIQKIVGNAVKEKKLIPVDWQGKCASDDCPFLATGVPAYRFIAYGEHHHRSNDTIDNLSKKMVAATTDIIVKGIKNVAF